MRFTRICLQLTVLSVSCLATGCMMVRGDQLQPPAQWPPEKPLQMKSIALEVKSQFESSGASKQNEAAMHLIEGQAQKAYTDSALFSHVTVSKEQADLLAEIQITEDGNKTLAGISGFISGFTMGIIPGYAHATLTSQTVFRNNAGEEIGTIKKSESISFWIQIFLVAAMPFRAEPKVVARDVYYDLNRATLAEARSKGYF
jgi:hypothetical protein